MAAPTNRLAPAKWFLVRFPIFFPVRFHGRPAVRAGQGGAVGGVSQLDEAGRGYVTDFIKMGIPGTYYWPNYNIADAAIVCGVIGLGITILMDDIRTQRAEKSAAADGADANALAADDGEQNVLPQMNSD